MMGLFSRWRRARILQRYAVPEALWQEALTALPFLADWPKGELEALRAMSVLFLCDKNIVGARGFAVTPFQRTVVAVQACIPVLKLGLEWYDDFETVVLCPDEFITYAEWEDEDGVIHRDDAPIMGEAMPGGPVVLSWPDALDAGRERDIYSLLPCGGGCPDTNPRPPSAATPFEKGAMAEEGEVRSFPPSPLPQGERGGKYDMPAVNVVIHEFVHKLDMKNGEANGCPPLPPELSAAYWQQTMERAYDDFCRRVDAEEDLDIDPYAAEDPAEFFAVLSETFFVASIRLRETYPDVYECFRLFYRWEPMWSHDSGKSSCFNKKTDSSDEPVSSQTKGNRG
ncbi:MAG: zinc-dependent peptidase [Burkholderiales bacterium]|jgi:Mlc titration factor MtfA (ptsG expression regulator)|nr:zinc-dependent peptidase [Burkholderiales bacterium]